MIWKISAENTS